MYAYSVNMHVYAYINVYMNMYMYNVGMQREQAEKIADFLGIPEENIDDVSVKYTCVIHVYSADLCNE